MTQCPSVLTTKCGRGLYVKPGALRHVWHHPGAPATIRIGVSDTDLADQEFPLTVELLSDGLHWPAQRVAREEPVGLKDEILFAYRENRSWPSPVIVDPDPPQVTQISLAVRWGDQRPRLITAWFGGEMFREPFDGSLSTREYVYSVIFWREHAFVWDAATMGTPFQSTWAEVLSL